VSTLKTLLKLCYSDLPSLVAGAILDRRCPRDTPRPCGGQWRRSNRRDGEEFGAALAEDAEIVPVRAAVDGTVYRGRGAGAQYCAAVDESWETLRWEIEEIREGGDWVLALGHIRGQGRGSGVGIDRRAGWVARFRHEEVASFHTYADRAEALSAVGGCRSS
jgi:ketosteroid isomerase-like protein